MCHKTYPFLEGGRTKEQRNPDNFSKVCGVVAVVLLFLLLVVVGLLLLLLCCCVCCCVVVCCCCPLGVMMCCSQLWLHISDDEQDHGASPPGRGCAGN